MGRIYSQASKVLVWLGEEARNSLAESAFQALKISTKLLETIPSGISTSEIQNEKVRSQIRSQLRENDVSLINVHTMFLIRKPWFTRAWTFQEICLASNAELLYGSEKIDWKSVTDYFALMNFVYPDVLKYGDFRISDALLEYQEYMKDPQTHKEHFQLSTMLRHIRRDASDPRDRIYAILNLSEVQGDPLFRPNYFESMEETYIRFTRAVIVRETRLQIISDADSEQRTEALPSWVRDWRYPSRARHTISSRKADGSARYTVIPSRYNKGIIIRTQHISKLGLFGWKIDEVRTTYDLSIFEYRDSYSTEWCDDVARISMLRKEMQNDDLATTYRQPPNLILARTLSADFLFCSGRVTREEKEKIFGWQNTLYEGFVKSQGLTGQVSHFQSNSEAMVDFLLSVERWREWKRLDDCWKTFRGADKQLRGEWEWPKECDAFETLRRDIFNHELDGDYTWTARKKVYSELFSTIKRNTTGRRLFTTMAGKLGIGPSTMTKEDNVYALLGGDVPYVLRRSANNSDFKLLGEVYIHGIMDGELFERDGDSALKMESVFLI